MSNEKDEEKKFKKMAFKVLESSPEDALQSKIIKLLYGGLSWLALPFMIR